MVQFISYQPVRDAYNDKGEPVLYRTHISEPDSNYNVYDPQNMMAQATLYRWASNEQQYVNGVSIAELHQYLFFDYPRVSKRSMGGTILQAVPYNPRLLKGETLKNGKACMTYVFTDRLDLVYGLEWMLSLWLWRVRKVKPEMISDLLHDLTTCEDGVMIDKFIEPMYRDVAIPDGMDWNSLWATHELKYEVGRPLGKREGIRPPAPKSRL